MKIRRDYESLINKLYQQEKTLSKEREQNPTAKAERDRVEISSLVVKLRKEVAGVEEQSPAREKRVEELASLVHEGRYRPDAHEIARRMLEEE